MVLGRKEAICWPKLANEITSFGERFKGRGIDNFLDDALMYVREGELILALHVICAQICEFDVAISESEYVEASRLLEVAEVEGRDLFLRCMMNLIVR